MAVDVKQAGAGDHVVGNLLGPHREAIVAPPQDGTLAGGTVDDDVGGLVGTAPADHHVIEVDAGVLEAFELDAAAEVVADRADVLGAQAEAGAGDEGAGHLAAGREVLFLERHLAGIGRKVRHDEKGIGGVEAHSNDVEFRHAGDYCKGIARERARDSGEARANSAADGGGRLRRGQQQTDEQDNRGASYKDHA